MKKSLIFFSLIIVFISCTEEFTVKSVPVNKTLVVNSFIQPDSVFSCYITHTYSLNDTSGHVVKEATVKIFDDSSNQLVCELPHWNNGYYRAESAFPEENKVYRLEVTAKGYPDVSATTFIPQKQKADNIYCLFAAGYEAWNSSKFDEFHFTLTDNDPSDNYFTFSYMYVEKTNSVFVPDSGFILLEDSIQTINNRHNYSGYTIIDAVIQNEGLMRYNPSYLYFSDELFNQQKHDFTIRGNFEYYDYAVFTLYTLNPDFYKFQVSLMHQLYEDGKKEVSRYDDFAGLDFSNDAVPIYSNIKGGYGIFAGFNTFKKYAPNAKPYYEYDEFGHAYRAREDFIRFEYDTIPPKYEDLPNING